MANGLLDAVAGEINCCSDVLGGEVHCKLLAGDKRRLLIAWSWLCRRKHRNWWREAGSGLPCQWRAKCYVIVKR